MEYDFEHIPKKGSAYVNQFLEEKLNPSKEGELVGIQEKGDIINYEGILKNNEGIWVYYTSDDNNQIKKYILAIDSNNEKFLNLPLINDGIYLIQPLDLNDQIFEMNDSKISLQEINLGDNQKFLFQFIPEDMLYRIICISSGNSLCLDEKNENHIKECEIFSENEIKWKLKTFDYNEFFLEDVKSNKNLEYDEKNKNIFLGEINEESRQQKFKIIFFEEDNKNNKNQENKNNENIVLDNKDNDEEKNIKNDDNINNKNENNENNKEENNININLDDNEEEEDEEDKEEEEDNEEEENIDNNDINMEINPEVKKYLDEKNKDPNSILKFSAPKFIITQEDINEIKDKEKIKHIEIDLSIEEIEENIFKDFTNIESIYCDPKWINKFDSKNIKEIYIKEGITNIKKEYFKFCFNLNLIYVPYSVGEIEENSFENSLQISTIIADYRWYKIFEVETFIVPRGTSVLKKDIFYNWKHLKLIIVPLSVQYIEESCFEQCFRLEEIEIPSGVKKIPRNCFKNCYNLKSIRIPDSVEYIDHTAFTGCINLENIYANDDIKKLFEKILKIPENKEIIKADDYSDLPNIETLEIPLGIKNVEKNFFKNFKNIRVINLDPNYIQYLDKKIINALTIPEGVKEIIPGTFKEMASLEYVEIPYTMEKIDKNEFNDCQNIISVKCQCKFLELFNNIKKNLNSIILIEGEINIDKDPFYDCENLENVVIPDCYKIYEEILFRNCHRLNTIKYLSGKQSKFNTLYEAPNDIKKINSEKYFFWTNVDTLIINENINEIEPDFLINCTDLQVVQIDPKFLNSIPKSEIACIIVPEFVKNIDEKNFKGCEKLKRVVIPSCYKMRKKILEII